MEFALNLFFALYFDKIELLLANQDQAFFTHNLNFLIFRSVKLDIIDDDECQRKKNPVCQHKCLNTKGSYRCSCDHGYRLHLDGHKCEGKVFLRNYFLRKYFVQFCDSFLRLHGCIQWFTLETQGVSLFHEGQIRQFWG